MEGDKFITVRLHKEEWEHILWAVERMSCGYGSDNFHSHCCDMNELVPVLRNVLKDERQDDQDVLIKLLKEMISDLKFYGNPVNKVGGENVVLNIMFEDAVEKYEREVKRMFGRYKI